MSPPEFDSQGNLAVGVHPAPLKEVIARFGHGTSQRQLVTSRLIRVYELANNTSKLERFIIFGSYDTAKADPNDVDIILIMHDDFTQQECAVEARPLFDHLRAQQEFGASVFAIRHRGFCPIFIRKWLFTTICTAGQTRRTMVCRRCTMIFQITRFE